jgi:transposase
MTAALLPEALWDLLEPFLPIPPPRLQGGRPRVPDRACLTGIVFVLRSGIPWEMLPQELGCGCGMTCWRRLRDWQHAAIWDAKSIPRGLRARHILPTAAVRRTRHGSGLGRWRWVVDSDFAWLNQFRLLRIRYDKRADITRRFCLGCTLIGWQFLRKNWAIG